MNSPIIANYQGGKLPLKEIEKSREIHRKLFATIEKNKDYYCYKCKMFEERAWEKEYLINKLVVTQSLVCNIQCSYCIQRNIEEDQKKPKYRLIPVLREIIRHKLLDPAGTVYWAGGEPAINREFDEALQLMIGYGVQNDIVSNATVFSKVIHEHLLPGNSTKLCTSVDCGTRETYLKIKKRDFFDRVWQNLKKYASKNGNVSAKYIVSDMNLDKLDLDGFVDKLLKNGIKKSFIDIDQNIPEGQVYKKHINAIMYLASKLKIRKIECEVGLNSVVTTPNLIRKIRLEL